MNKRLSMDNKEILWKISEGDLQALESLFLEYQPKLVAFIDKFISDHEQGPRHGVGHIFGDLEETSWVEKGEMLFSLSFQDGAFPSL